LRHDEALALQSALKSDKDLRARYLDYMNLGITLEAKAAPALAAATRELLTAPISKEKPRSRGWLSWRPPDAAAAGIVRTPRATRLATSRWILAN